MRRPKRVPKIPSRHQISECYYVKIMITSPDFITGDRGEWAPILDEDNPCLGIIRISHAESTAMQWEVYQHELNHVRNDYFFVSKADKWTTTYEEKENGEPTVL